VICLVGDRVLGLDTYSLGYWADVDSCVVQQQRKEQQDEAARSCMALALQAP
jgi:hypothetical protein